MSMVRLVAIEPCNQHAPGTDFLATEREAGQLVKRRLAKLAAPVPANKMMPPAANKANPSPAAGRVRPSSASPAARASVQTTAQPSPRGARPPAKMARSPSDGSSQ